MSVVARPQRSGGRTVAPRAGSRPAALRTLLAGLALALATVVVMALGAPSARASGLALTAFEITHDDEGVFLSYAIDIDLSRVVDDALGKGVPLFFVARAEVYRSRFYWRDQRVGEAIRRWRIAYQPLTSSYRVTFDGGLSQNYASRAEAFDAIGRSVDWRVAEAGQIDADSRQYVEFSYRLDTTQLPRPMQIGINGQADWVLSVQRAQKIEPAAKVAQ